MPGDLTLICGLFRKLVAREEFPTRCFRAWKQRVEAQLNLLETGHAEGNSLQI